MRVATALGVAILDPRRVAVARVSGSDPVVSMIGSGSAPAMLAARALLAGNGVTHRWIDTDTDPVGRLLAEQARLGVERPVAVFADGSQLPAPAEFVDPRRRASGASPSTLRPSAISVSGWRCRHERAGRVRILRSLPSSCRRAL
jgi:hypothetical protein